MKSFMFPFSYFQIVQIPISFQKFKTNILLFQENYRRVIGSPLKLNIRKLCLMSVILNLALVFLITLFGTAFHRRTTWHGWIVFLGCGLWWIVCSSQTFSFFRAPTSWSTPSRLSVKPYKENFCRKTGGRKKQDLCCRNIVCCG